MKFLITNNGMRVWWECPGCLGRHTLPLIDHTTLGSKGCSWSWNGSVNTPTLTPSLKITTGKDKICHCFITKGRVQFCSDSHHKLAGQTVDLPDIEKGNNDGKKKTKA